MWSFFCGEIILHTAAAKPQYMLLHSWHCSEDLLRSATPQETVGKEQRGMFLP